MSKQKTGERKQLASEKRAERKLRRKQKRENRTPFAKAMRWIVTVVGIAVLVFAGIQVYKYIDVVVNKPQDAFFSPAPVMTPALQTKEPDSTASASETEIPSNIRDELEREADKTIITDGILNVLLVGVDYADERVSDDWNGKRAFHADVMMIVAINFKENKVDLISLPRDTYAQIPGVKGIYKLNASLDCGGGMGEAGYEKVCEAAEWMLGGIPVDYYYAVTMPIVKRLGNAVGGIDYDVDMDFTMAGRSYRAGMQHLDGQGILDYLRVRKGVEESGDLNRVNRQKKLLIALFSEMKRTNKLALIPEILSSFGKDVATNTSIQQTMALTLWALNLDAENIAMSSIGGQINNVFAWNFCLTDQENRVKVIKEVYGVEVEPYLEYTKDYAHYRWQSMLYGQALKTTDGLIAKIQELYGSFIPDDVELPVEPIKPDVGIDKAVFAAVVGACSANATEEPTQTPETTDSPEITPEPSTSPEPSASPTAESPFGDAHHDAYAWVVQSYNDMVAAYKESRRQAKLFLEGKQNDLAGCTLTLSRQRDRFIAAAKNAAEVFNIGRNFFWGYQYWLDPEFNEIMVDFR